MQDTKTLDPRKQYVWRFEIFIEGASLSYVSTHYTGFAENAKSRLRELRRQVRRIQPRRTFFSRMTSVGVRPPKTMRPAVRA